MPGQHYGWPAAEVADPGRPGPGASVRPPAGPRRSPSDPPATGPSGPSSGASSVEGRRRGGRGGHHSPLEGRGGAVGGGRRGPGRGPRWPAGGGGRPAAWRCGRSRRGPARPARGPGPVARPGPTARPPRRSRGRAGGCGPTGPPPRRTAGSRPGLTRAWSRGATSLGGRGSGRQRPAADLVGAGGDDGGQAGRVEAVEEAVGQGLGHQEIGLVVDAGHQAAARGETPGVEIDVAAALEETQGAVHAAGQGMVVVGAHELGEGAVEDLVGLVGRRSAGPGSRPGCTRPGTTTSARGAGEVASVASVGHGDLAGTRPPRRGPPSRGPAGRPAR